MCDLISDNNCSLNGKHNYQNIQQKFASVSAFQSPVCQLVRAQVTLRSLEVRGRAKLSFLGCFRPTTFPVPPENSWRVATHSCICPRQPRAHTFAHHFAPPRLVYNTWRLCSSSRPTIVCASERKGRRERGRQLAKAEKVKASEAFFCCGGWRCGYLYLNRSGGTVLLSSTTPIIPTTLA